MKESTPAVQRHEEIIHFLKERLKKNGVPDNAIVEKWGIRNQYIADLAILSQEYNIPISVFEIKVNPVIGNPLLDSVVRQFKRLVTSLNITVSCYFVVSDRKTGGIEIFNISDAVYNDSSLSLDELPALKCENFDFSTMKNNAERKIQAENDKKREKKQDNFAVVCFVIFPIVALIILLLDMFKVYVITRDRLLFYAGVVLAVLLPFFQVLPFGAKRKNDSEEEKK